jgi:methylenetetrahydrofolate--tRNA-(uracil-5-)-methyltransferase
MYPLIIATGPLTSDTLSADIAAMVGSDHLYFYDAVSPIVLAESLDMTKVFRASRWGRSLRGTMGSDPGDRSTTGSDPGAAPTQGLDTGRLRGQTPVTLRLKALIRIDYGV